MIEAKDLRIGSKIISKGLMNGHVLTVDQVHGAGTLHETKRVIFFKETAVGEFIEDLEGIPLTEEILIKAGLDKDWLPDFSKEIDCSILQNGKVYAFKRGGRIIRYVHELQNLWKENTGEELTINL